MSYYDAPSDEVFNEIKQAAIAIWETYDDTYGYATEKINSIKDITNVRDNWGYMVGMFDQDNQLKLFMAIGDDAKQKMAEWL